MNESLSTFYNNPNSTSQAVIWLVNKQFFWPLQVSEENKTNDFVVRDFLAKCEGVSTV